ncbi:hypothetical protein BH10BAC2_BH10BAC2_40490 [soil metagenome]
MKTILSLLIFILFGCGSIAQQNASYAFERLFNLKEGLSKEAVADSITNIYNLDPVSAGRNNSSSILIYKTETIACFKGSGSKLQFEFINNKLYKAYIQTEFARADYYEMLDNFNALRSMIKPGWEHEKEIKYAMDNLVSTGYDYSKAKQTKSKTDKISLQYINTKPDKGFGIYLLQLSWINSSHGGIESIVY